MPYPDALRRSRRGRHSYGPQITRRNFTVLSAAAGQYYQLSSSVMLSGDFEIKITVQALSSSLMVFSGGVSGGGFELFIDSSGFLQFRFNGINPGGTGGVSVNDGNLHNIVISRNGSSITTKVDNVPDASATIASPVLINVIARRDNAAFYLDGIIANLIVQDAGTTVVDIPFNTDLSDPVIPNLAVGNSGAPANATAINGPTAELYSLNTSTNPEQWENSDKSKIIPVA